MDAAGTLKEKEITLLQSVVESSQRQAHFPREVRLSFIIPEPRNEIIPTNVGMQRGEGRAERKKATDGYRRLALYSVGDCPR